jgi:hypothetical protein
MSSGKEIAGIYLSKHKDGKIAGAVSLNLDCPYGCSLRAICYVRRTFQTCPAAEQRYKRNSAIWDQETIPDDQLSAMAEYINKKGEFFRPCSAGDINGDVSADNLRRLLKLITIPKGTWITDRNLMFSRFFSGIRNYSNKHIGTVQSATFHNCDNSFNLYRTEDERKEMVDAARSINLQPYECAKKCIDCKKMPCYRGKGYAILEKVK